MLDGEKPSETCKPVGSKDEPLVYVVCNAFVLPGVRPSLHDLISLGKTNGIEVTVKFGAPESINRLRKSRGLVGSRAKSNAFVLPGVRPGLHDLVSLGKTNGIEVTLISIAPKSIYRCSRRASIIESSSNPSDSLVIPCIARVLIYN